MVENAHTTDGLGKRYGAFGKVGLLLVVRRFEVDRGAEARFVNKYVNIKEGEMVQVNQTG
jgi:hypothetical protein